MKHTDFHSIYSCWGGLKPQSYSVNEYLVRLRDYYSLALLLRWSVEVKCQPFGFAPPGAPMPISLHKKEKKRFAKRGFAFEPNQFLVVII